MKLTNEEHFLNVVKQIVELDKKHDHKFHLISKFLDRLSYLNSWGDQGLTGRSIVELSSDVAPLSFYLLFRDRSGKPVMNGGLLFHNGAGMSDGTYAVEIDPEPGPHWSVHT